MTHQNPFDIILIVTTIMLIAITCFGFAAPALMGPQTLVTPVLSQLPSLGYSGNSTGLWAYDETQNVTYEGWGLTIYDYTVFQPKKEVTIYEDGGIIVRRAGQALWIVPWNYEQPLFFENGTNTGGLSALDIIYNFNLTTGHTTILIDYLNGVGYAANMEISPLTGYAATVEGMMDSFNTGHGYQIRIFTNEYAAPTWTDQLGAYLSWFAGLIVYGVAFIAYGIQVMALFFVFLGLGAAVGAGIVVLLIIIFIGSILIYIRGVKLH